MSEQRPVFEAPATVTPETLERPGLRGARFFNRWAPMPDHTAAFVRWRLERNAYREMRRRRPEVPVATNDGSYLTAASEAPSVTWIGHSTVLVHDEGDVWLTDPIFSPRIFVLRRHHPPAIPLARIPTPRFVVVSHDHYDHLDLPTLRALPTETVIAAPRKLASASKGRPPADASSASRRSFAMRGFAGCLSGFLILRSRRGATAVGAG